MVRVRTNDGEYVFDQATTFDTHEGGLTLFRLQAANPGERVIAKFAAGGWISAWSVDPKQEAKKQAPGPAPLVK